MDIKGVAKAAVAFDISKTHLEKLMVDPSFPSTKNGKIRVFTVEGVHKFLVKHELNKTKPDRENIAAAKLRTEQLKADRLELDLMVDRGELIDANQIANLIQPVLISTSDALDSLVVKLRRECPHIDHRDFEVIESTIAKARNEMADELPTIIAKGFK